MEDLQFILVRKAKYIIYIPKKHISEHIMREFDTIYYPIFIESLSSIDLVERRTIIPEYDHKWQLKNTSDW